MRHGLIVTAVLPFLFLVGPAPAAASPEAKACSDAASAKGFTGAARESFRATCLQGSNPGAAAVQTSAPSRAAVKPVAASASACSAQASARGLTGAARENFRASCLKGTIAAGASIASPKPAPVSAIAKPAAGLDAKSPASPASPASAACSQQADGKGLHGTAREAFRDQCLKGSSRVAAKPQPVAKPLPVVPPEPGSSAARSVKSTGARTANQVAADKRINTCGQQWQTAKAPRRLPASQTWPQFWSICSARSKAAGQ